MKNLISLVSLLLLYVMVVAQTAFQPGSTYSYDQPAGSVDRLATGVSIVLLSLVICYFIYLSEKGRSRVEENKNQKVKS